MTTNRQPLSSRATDPRDEKAIRTLCLDARAGRVDRVRRAILRGIDLNATCGQHGSPLFSAIRGRSMDCARLLLESGARLYSVDRTLIEHGAWTEFAEILVRLGADVNCLDERGNSPLLQAARSDDVVAARWLIRRGADINLCRRGEMTPLQRAAAARSDKVVALLVRRGASVETTSLRDKQTALHIACSSYVLDADQERAFRRTVRLICGASKDIDRPDKTGSTALAQAALGPSAYAVRMLLRHGADTDSTDMHGHTPLILAAQHGHAGAIRWLVRAGASLNHRNKRGQTALIRGVARPSIVRQLIRAGADPNIADNDGRRAIDYAEREKAVESAEILRKLAAGSALRSTRG